MLVIFIALSGIQKKIVHVETQTVDLKFLRLDFFVLVIKILLALEVVYHLSDVHISTHSVGANLYYYCTNDTTQI